MCLYTFYLDIIACSEVTWATCSSSSGLPITLFCISLISCWYSLLRCSSCLLHRIPVSSSQSTTTLLLSFYLNSLSLLWWVCDRAKWVSLAWARCDTTLCSFLSRCLCFSLQRSSSSSTFLLCSSTFLLRKKSLVTKVGSGGQGRIWSKWDQMDEDMGVTTGGIHHLRYDIILLFSHDSIILLGALLHSELYRNKHHYCLSSLTSFLRGKVSLEICLICWTNVKRRLMYNCLPFFLKMRPLSDGYFRNPNVKFHLHYICNYSHCCIIWSWRPFGGGSQGSWLHHVRSEHWGSQHKEEQLRAGSLNRTGLRWFPWKPCILLYLTASCRFLVALVTLVGSSSKLPDSDEQRLEVGVRGSPGLMNGQRCSRGLLCSRPMSSRTCSRRDEIWEVLSSNGSQIVVCFNSLCFFRCSWKHL